MSHKKQSYNKILNLCLKNSSNSKNFTNNLWGNLVIKINSWLYSWKLLSIIWKRKNNKLKKSPLPLMKSKWQKIMWRINTVNSLNCINKKRTFTNNNFQMLTIKFTSSDHLCKKNNKWNKNWSEQMKNWEIKSKIHLPYNNHQTFSKWILKLYKMMFKDSTNKKIWSKSNDNLLVSNSVNPEWNSNS